MKHIETFAQHSVRDRAHMGAQRLPRYTLYTLNNTTAFNLFLETPKLEYSSPLVHFAIPQIAEETCSRPSAFVWLCGDIVRSMRTGIALRSAPPVLPSLCLVVKKLLSLARLDCFCQQLLKANVCLHSHMQCYVLSATRTLVLRMHVLPPDITSDLRRAKL